MGERRGLTGGGDGCDSASVGVYGWDTAIVTLERRLARKGLTRLQRTRLQATLKVAKRNQTKAVTRVWRCHARTADGILV